MNNADTRTAALYMIDNERNRQDEKWGQQDHEPSKWVHILGEEFGEYCEAVNETVFDNGEQSKLKGGYENMLKELTHIAAVAVGAMECLMRNEASQEAKKINALNSLDIVDYSCSGGTCEYVLASVTAENIKILLDVGFTAEQIDESTGDDGDFIDLSILAFQHLNAIWWGTETGFTQESYEPPLSESPDDEQHCRVCGCTWNNACPGGCYWVEDDLCSKCAETVNSDG